MPGIGSTYGAGFLANNIFGTRAGITGVESVGDTNTTILGLTEAHLIKDHVVMDYYLYATKIPFQIYDRGGLGDPNSYFNSVNKEYGGSVEVDLNYWERRIQFNTQLGTSRLQYQTVAGPDGTGYSHTDSSEFATFNPTLRFLLDLTDDNVDPRKGIKIQLIRDQTVLYDGMHSRFANYYGIATAYVPILSSSTWAFNIFRSSAVMESQNNLSAAQLESGMGLSCPNTDPTSLANCQNVDAHRIQERLTENQYGTAGMLGGPEELRGFPLNRFHGSQTLFYATEFRWNIFDSSRPIDLGFASGTISVLQIAPFYEIGAVSDPPAAIEQAPMRASYGVGFRASFSGSLVRADIGMSNEGPQFTFFVGYPWDMSPF